MTASAGTSIDSEPEDDPNGDEWDDLNLKVDARDGDDPLVVTSEYE